MAKDKSAVQNPETSAETLTQTSNDVITQNDVVGTEVGEVVDNTVDPITTPEIIDQPTITPEPEAKLIETSTPEIIDQPTITPEPEAKLIESSTPELNAAKESTLSDEAPVKAKIISMTVRPTGSFVM